MKFDWRDLQAGRRHLIYTGCGQDRTGKELGTELDSSEKQGWALSQYHFLHVDKGLLT